MLATTTGEPTRSQLEWAAVLHAGPGSALGALTAAERHGLRGWSRPEVTVLIGESVNVEPMPGVTFVKTRRDIVGFQAPRLALPTWQVEPAILLFAGYTRSSRTAVGVLAAAVQKRVSTPQRADLIALGVRSTWPRSRRGSCSPRPCASPSSTA